MAEIRTRHVRILAPRMELTEGAGGVRYARSPVALGAYPPTLVARLETGAERHPDRAFLAERTGPASGWRVLTFGAALEQARAVAQSLVDRRLSADRPVAILSGNSIDHAVVALGSMYAGVPYAPLAPSYSLISRDHSALRILMGVLQPGLVFAVEGPAFETAIHATVPGGTEVVTVTPMAARVSTPLAALSATRAGDGADRARAALRPETIAKILFTSGSTGSPKGVINTHGMLAANQAQLVSAMPFLGDSPPVLCDWLPWNHTFGGNHNVGIALYNGGTLHIDAGRPVPGLFDETLRNLREVATTAYFNVPKGFEMLLPALKADEAFRRHFFSRLQMLFYAAAGLRQSVADEFVQVAIETCGERIPWVTGLGATETAPFALCTGAQVAMTARIGVPVPGVELKVVPIGDRREARVRGPNVTPGYWRDDVLTRDAFDEEGFYKMGDAIGFADPDDPLQGFVFQGRIAEDFKLSTGTWVRVGPLRARLLAVIGDLVQDVVITGHERDFVGALLFPQVSAWRARSGADPGMSLRDMLGAPEAQAELSSRLREFAAANPGSSTAVRRAALLELPPSLDAGEVTDKGSLNQRAVLIRRAAIVDQIYGAPGDAVVLDIPQKGSDA